MLVDAEQVNPQHLFKCYNLSVREGNDAYRSCYAAVARVSEEHLERCQKLEEQRRPRVHDIPGGNVTKKQREKDRLTLQIEKHGEGRVGDVPVRSLNVTGWRVVCRRQHARDALTRRYKIAGQHLTRDITCCVSEGIIFSNGSSLSWALSFAHTRRSTSTPPASARRFCERSPGCSRAIRPTRRLCCACCREQAALCSLAPKSCTPFERRSGQRHCQ